MTKKDLDWLKGCHVSIKVIGEPGSANRDKVQQMKRRARRRGLSVSIDIPPRAKQLLHKGKKP